MRLGLLPSQKRELERAFKKAKAFDRFRSRTRRAFVGGGVAALGAAVASFWAGTRTGSGQPSPTVESQLTPRHRLARRLAAASDDDLERDRHTFLQILETEVRGDPVSWVGFRRLTRMAVATRDRDRGIRLLKAWRLAQPTAEVADLLTDLNRLVQ